MLALASASVTAAAAAHGYRLREVSLEVRPGEVLAVLGPNGAGKSTLVGLLAGSLAPDAGGVTLDGEALSAVAPGRLSRRRAVLAQHSPLAFGFRVEEVVALGRAPHAGCGRDVDRAATLRSLEVAGAGGLVGRDYTTLSGGERQRVHFARALAQLDVGIGSCGGDTDAGGTGDGARYLLLDEPTAALDLAHQQAVLGTAGRLAREHGVGVLAVLHDPNLAALHADRIAVLDRARLHAAGTPAEVLDAQLFAEVFGLEVDVMAQPRHPDRPLVVAVGRRTPMPETDRRRTGSNRLVARPETLESPHGSWRCK